MKPIDVILWFGIAAAACTLVVVIFTFLHNKHSSEKSTATLENTKQLIDENKELKETVKEQSNKIDQLRRENIELALNLQDESLKIYKNLTGGGHKPVLLVEAGTLNIDESGNLPAHFMIQFIIRNYSGYSFRNLRIRIVDMGGKEMVRRGVKQTVDGMLMSSGVMDVEKEYKDFDMQPVFELGTLAPKAFELFYRTTYSPRVINMDAHYTVDINWDNGHLMHFITLKVDGEKLVQGEWEGTFNGKRLPQNSTFMFLSN